MTLNGEALAASQENALEAELFLQENYLFRRNVLNGKVEFATLPAEEPHYRALTQEALNSIVIRAKRENICEKGNPKTEIMELIHSEEVREHNPIKEYLESLPKWDGQNHVAQLFSSARSCTDSWPSGFAQPLPTGCRWIKCTAMSVCRP